MSKKYAPLWLEVHLEGCCKFYFVLWTLLDKRPRLSCCFFDKSNMYILSNTDNAAQRNKSMDQVFLKENEKLVFACITIKILSLYPFCILKKMYYEQKKIGAENLIFLFFCCLGKWN